jgi:hypothetical protein
MEGTLMADIHYYRILKTNKGAVFGEMTVAGESFVAVENRSKAGYDSIPAGIYNLKKDTKHSDSGEEVPCLRFIEIPGRKGKGNPFLIHRAKNDKWSTLAGCIAPGLSVSSKDEAFKVQESVKAMDMILKLLGDSRKVFTISIQNHAPGDKWTKEEFIGRRHNRLRT